MAWTIGWIILFYEFKLVVCPHFVLWPGVASIPDCSGQRVIAGLLERTIVSDMAAHHSLFRPQFRGLS